MTDKPKFMYTPTSLTPPTSNGRTYQTSTTSPVQVPYLGFNSSLVADRSSASTTSSQASGLASHKNFSASMQQLQRKMEILYPSLRKEQVRHGSEQPDLRSSVSSNQIKKFEKFDKEMLRKTTYTPNNSKTFNLGDRFEESNQPSSLEQPPHGMFYKKQMEPIDRKPLQKTAFFRSLTQPDDRPVPQKKSPIVCGFYLGKQLGVGKFGQVYLAKHVASGFVVALKKIVKAKVRQYNMINQLIQQIKIQAFLSHPNIVQYYSVVSDIDNIYIVLEYMEGGTLFDFMNNRMRLIESQVVIYLRQITQALKEMHDKGLAHRDLKPQNIVMSFGFSKLCDFGWAARVQGARKTFCGTKQYVPPEILERKQYDETADLWCLGKNRTNIGILAYELLTGRVPFEHIQRKKLVQKIVNVDKDKIVFPAEMSDCAKDFIENLIKKNPNERMKTYRLLQHPFLAEQQPSLSPERSPTIRR